MDPFETSFFGRPVARILDEGSLPFFQLTRPPNQRKLGSNLPSYGWLLPNEGRCETLHHIRIHSMKGGVRLWCETWHHTTIHSCNGCMIVVIWCCHVRRYMRVSHVMLQNALWWLHECCMGLVVEEAGAPNLLFFRVKWLQPAMKGTSCVWRLRPRSRFIRDLVPPLCSATTGCSSVHNSLRFLNLWLQIALEMATWLLSSGVAMCVATCRFATWCCETRCNGCMNVAWGLCWGGSRSTKPSVFPCKMVAASDERYLLFAAVAAAVDFIRELVLPLYSARSGCSCVRSSMRFLNLWLQIALEWLHDCCHLVLPCA